MDGCCEIGLFEIEIIAGDRIMMFSIVVEVVRMVYCSIIVPLVAPFNVALIINPLKSS